MNYQIPCPRHSDGHSYREPEDDDEVCAPEYRNHINISAIEESNSVNVRGLCRMWDHYRDSSNLVWILHGFMMITPIACSNEAWREFDFLQELLTTEKGDK